MAWEVCLLPKDVGPGKAAMRRWYFNANTGTCQKFIYGGVKGNPNNFETKAACEERCKVPTCELPPANGDGEVACMAYMERWHWNSTSQKCEIFIYGGCGGNANNFNSRMACAKHCAPKPRLCQLKPAVGKCRASIRRFYYDEKTNTCKPFFWGGCGGNANKFKTRAACAMLCMKAEF